MMAAARCHRIPEGCSGDRALIAAPYARRKSDDAFAADDMLMLRNAMIRRVRAR